MAEQGVKMLASEGWTAMWAPARTPPAEIARMQQALREVLQTPAVRELMLTRLSVVPAYQDAAQMARRQREELAAWEPIIKASGFKAE
jgi:tripartite-type tricarboxylate transporter receptor subunit TctC